MAGEERKAWGRMEGETSLAYTNFLAYLKLGPRVRTIERAYHSVEGLPLDSPIEVPSHWWKWSARWDWLRRALAYDTEVQEIELSKWEKRKEEARERDWQQAEKLREIVDGALPTASQFFRRNVGAPQGGTPSVVNEAGVTIRQGVPSQVIVTVAFDVVGMTNVLKEASKMQRLTVNEPTDNINNLTGPALDAALKRALLLYGVDPDDPGEEGTPEDAPYESERFPEGDEEDFDAGADEGD